MMEVRIKKWGNSAAVRIPAGVLDAANVALDQRVNVREEGGRILIEPVRKKRYSLNDLVAGITSDNLHSPVDFGKAVGREAGRR